MKIQKIISLPIQAMHLRNKFPKSTVNIRLGSLTWYGELTPTPLSTCYYVQLKITQNKLPCVEILNPKLKTRNGKRCEHMYSERKPCLFWSRTKEWDESKLLVNTIIPWISEWLFFYELWVATGHWAGGGVHPPIPKPKNSRMQWRN